MSSTVGQGDPGNPPDPVPFVAERAVAAEEAVDRSQWPRLQRRTLTVLFASVILGRASMTIGFAVAALLIQELLGSGTWAGASTAAVTIGTAFSASMLSNYMYRNGRRPGLALGYLAASAGALIAVAGGQSRLLPVYILGLAFVGVGQGGTNLARYAAADLARPEHRGQAISWVVFASTVGAVGGPALVGPGSDLAVQFGLNELVGPFLLSAVFFAGAALVVWLALRPDPLRVSGGLRPASPMERRRGFSDGLAAIRAEPLAIAAVVGLTLSQAVMVMVMAMTPLHMRDHGQGLDLVGYILSVHTAGMFAFAPVAGWASDRFSRVVSLLAAGVMLVGATVLTALAGDSPLILMFPGLFLLGLGWSFGIVAASALITDVVPADDQVAAQGSADLITSFASGLGALASGMVFTIAGFPVLSLVGLVGAVTVILTAGLVLGQDRGHPAVV
ncbi:MAG: MFS transporter [Acidimicrobiales bacterium]